MVTSPQYLWFFWPLLGWGIGVVFHGIKVFNYMPFIGKDWEERKIKEFMDENGHGKLWECRSDLDELLDIDTWDGELFHLTEAFDNGTMHFEVIGAANPFLR